MSGEVSLVDKLKEEITCKICFEEFVEPRILICQHTFCKRCLQALVKNSYINCPICRAPTSIDPRKGVQALPINFTIQNIAELISKSRPVVPIVPAQVVVPASRVFSMKVSNEEDFAHVDSSLISRFRGRSICPETVGCDLPWKGGRKMENTIVINAANVSRCHFELFYSEEGRRVMLQDVNSSIGTFIKMKPFVPVAIKSKMRFLLASSLYLCTIEERVIASGFSTPSSQPQPAQIQPQPSAQLFSTSTSTVRQNTVAPPPPPLPDLNFDDDFFPVGEGEENQQRQEDPTTTLGQLVLSTTTTSSNNNAENFNKLPGFGSGFGFGFNSHATTLVLGGPNGNKSAAEIIGGGGKEKEKEKESGSISISIEEKMNALALSRLGRADVTPEMSEIESAICQFSEMHGARTVHMTAGSSPMRQMRECGAPAREEDNLLFEDATVALGGVPILPFPSSATRRGGPPPPPPRVSSPPITSSPIISQSPITIPILTLECIEGPLYADKEKNVRKMSPGETVMLGRGEACEKGMSKFSSQDAGVSRQHAVIRCIDGVWHIEDRRSGNGTYFQIPAKEPFQLEQGTVFRVGDYDFVVESIP